MDKFPNERLPQRNLQVENELNYPDVDNAIAHGSLRFRNFSTVK